LVVRSYGDGLEQHLRANQPVKASGLCDVYFPVEQPLEILKEANMVEGGGV
jgi:hypothetical protein